MLLLNYFSFLRQLAGSGSYYQKYPTYIFKKDSCIEGISSVDLLLLQEEKHKIVFFLLFSLSLFYFLRKKFK